MFDSLIQDLMGCFSPAEKIDILKGWPGTQLSSEVLALADLLSEQQKVVLFSLLVAGQGERLLTTYEAKKIIPLLDQLMEVERFYTSIGGLIGYHARMVELLEAQEGSELPSKVRYVSPEGFSIAEETEEVRKSVFEGIRTMPLLAEMYPLGGAADRLRLYNEKTGAPLPAARLPMMGKTVLEGLIADLQSREYLHYKLFGCQLTTDRKSVV